MSADATATIPERPPYPVGELADFELKEYRGQLERALRDETIGNAPIAATLRARLASVTAEETERSRNRTGNTGTGGRGKD